MQVNSFQGCVGVSGGNYGLSQRQTAVIRWNLRVQIKAEAACAQEIGG
jgi:hypothetical protein